MGEMVTESWFGSLWSKSWKYAPKNNRAAIGVLAFEVASLMFKVVNLWDLLSDKEINRLRKEICNSVGIQKLVSDDDHYLMDLALNEILENFILVSRSVARLGRKCIDPHFCHFENFVNDPIQNNLEWLGWEYRQKKMERKVKKMERFVAMTMQLSQELEVLAELEQTFRRMQVNPSTDRVKLLEFQQKVMWQRQEVSNLREMSPWIRSYDYIVRLLARSLLTILERIKHVLEPSGQRSNDRKHMSPDCLPRTRSFSALTSIHRSEIMVRGFASAPLGRSCSKSSLLQRKHPNLNTKRLGPVGPFKGCMSGSDSPIVEGCKPVPAMGGSMRFTLGEYVKNSNEMENSSTNFFSCNSGIYSKLSLLTSKHALLNAPPSTLGDAALAIHYANMIIVIEKLASSPHMIDLDARDDLYNMLPTNLRAALRAKLKPYAKSLSSSANDASLATEWSLALQHILDWLSPLAHNTIKWQSERSFEKEREVSGTNVLLVQTLHFANQGKTDAAIVELLVGLNYLCRIYGEVNENVSPEFSGSKANHCYTQKMDGRPLNVVYGL